MRSRLLGTALVIVVFLPILSLRVPYTHGTESELQHTREDLISEIYDAQAFKLTVPGLARDSSGAGEPRPPVMPVLSGHLPTGSALTDFLQAQTSYLDVARQQPTNVMLRGRAEQTSDTGFLLRQHNVLEGGADLSGGLGWFDDETIPIFVNGSTNGAAIVRPNADLIVLGSVSGSGVSALKVISAETLGSSGANSVPAPLNPPSASSAAATGSSVLSFQGGVGLPGVNLRSPEIDLTAVGGGVAPLIPLISTLRAAGCADPRVFVSVQAIIGAGASWAFPFSVSATGDLRQGERGVLTVSAVPAYAADVFKMQFGISVGADWKVRSGCGEFSAFNLGLGKAFAVDGDGPAPLAGQTIQADSSSCVLLGLSIYGVDVAGLDVCVDVEIEGTAMIGTATAGANSVALVPEGRNLSVTPTGSPLLISLGGARYSPLAKWTASLNLAFAKNHLWSADGTPDWVQLDSGAAAGSLILPVSAAAKTPTATQVLPTATRVPPTATPVPPTATRVPPTPTPSGSPPAPPSNVQFGFIGCGPAGPCRLVVTWSDNSNNENGFHVYACTDTTCYSLATAQVNQTSADLPEQSPVPPLESYCYFVAAFNGFGESAKTKQFGCG